MWRSLKSFIEEKFIKPKKEVTQCNICLEKCSKIDLLKICSCDHQFCRKCLQQHVDSKIQSYEIIHCPEQDCQAKINQSGEFYTKFPQRKIKIYEKIKRFYFVSNNPNFKLCPREQCSGMINIKILGSSPCSVCGQKYCPKCLYKEHRGKCQKESILHLENDLNFIQCRNCDFIIEKNQGCDHIKCRCGYQLCYKCGGVWKGSGHLCIRSKSFQKIRSACLFIQNKVSLLYSNTVLEKIVKQSFNIVKKVILFNLILSIALTLLKIVGDILLFLLQDTPLFNFKESQGTSTWTYVIWILSFIVGMVFAIIEGSKAFHRKGFKAFQRKVFIILLITFGLYHYLSILFYVFYYEMVILIFVFDHLIACAIGAIIILCVAISSQKLRNSNKTQVTAPKYH